MPPARFGLVAEVRSLTYHQCNALSKTAGLEGKIWTPDQQRYDTRLTQYYSANAAQAPWCMVFPESAEDVSAVVKTLGENSCPFGMRSGAHSAFQGANGIKDGVTVDFGKIILFYVRLPLLTSLRIYERHDI